MHPLTDLLLPLAQNISLFVLFAVAYSVLQPRTGLRSPLLSEAVSGLVFGGGALLAMASPFQLADGLFVDARIVVIIVATAIGGPLSGLICTAVAATYRIYIGGIGLAPALAGMATTFLLSVLLLRVCESRGRTITAAGLAAFGFVVAGANLATFGLLPAAVDTSAVLHRIAVPVLVLTPAGTYLAAAMTFWTKQRENLQRRLTSANHRLELALMGSQDGVFDYKPSSREMWTSQRYREMRGYGAKAEDTSLQFWRSLVLDEDRAEMEQLFAELEAGSIDRIDMLKRTRHQNGRLLHIRSRAVSQKDEEGKVVRIVGSSSDETARVEAETRLRDAIGSMESGFAYFDGEDRLVVCNDTYIDPGTRQRFGDPVGRTFDEIMAAFAGGEFTAVAALKDRQAWLRWRTEQHRDPPARPLEIQWTDGRWFSVLERRTSDGGSVGIWTDITDQKLREMEIQSAKNKMEAQAAQMVALAESTEVARAEAVVSRRIAEHANLEKSRFLASMSHELRTPLNAVIGFAEIMEAQVFGVIQPAKYREYAALIRESGGHLLSLINDVLDLSKVEAGRMTLSIEQISPEQMCRQAVELTRGLAFQKGVQIEGRVQPNLSVIYGDQRAVTQILLNLLSNAIKFTSHGGHVGLDMYASHEGAVVRVTDTGIGMTASEMETALEPYGQVNSPLAKASVGTGLGLPLAKSLVELHGGSLTIASEKGVGTSIVVQLPHKAA